MGNCWGEEYKNIRAKSGTGQIKYIPVAGNLISGEPVQFHVPFHVQ